MYPIYLDYNATTPIDPAVYRAMLPFLGDGSDPFAGHFGNPSSSHVFGKKAHDAVDDARTQVAALLGANADEIVFTGGGTEASNHALKGAVLSIVAKAHIITSAIEHPATLRPCEFLQRLGCKVTILGVDRHGLVDPDAVARVLRGSSGVTVVSIMHANNEVGTLQPIADIAALAKSHGALMHTDAAQSLGKVPVNVEELRVDLLSVAGHKLYAPKGIGVLYVRRGVQLEPLLHGAGHEKGRRAGTENVPYMVALGKACELAGQNIDRTSQRLTMLRERLWSKLQAGLGERVVLNGHPELRLPNTLNCNFVGQIGAEVLQRAEGVAASTGSACHEGQVTLSPVLKAMGVPEELGRGAVRLTLGRYSTEDEIDRAADLLVKAALR